MIDYAETSQKKFYTGSWEHNGRSLTAAAIIALIGIGILYFYAQSFLTTIALAVTQGFQKTKGALEQGSGSLSTTSIAVIRVIVFVSQYAFILIPSWLLIRRLHTKQFFDYVRLKRISFTETGLATAGAVILFPINIFFSTFLVESLGIPEKLMRANASLFTSYTPAEFVWLLFAIAVTPAICEEVFFRGQVQRTLERSLSVHSVWIVGVVFGLFHFQPLGLASLSLLGLYFGYVYFRSKSLYPSMAAHFTNNALALLFTYQPFIKDQEWIASAKSGDLGLLAAGAVPFAVGAIFLFHKKTAKPRERFEDVEQISKKPFAGMFNRTSDSDEEFLSSEIIQQPLAGIVLERTLWRVSVRKRDFSTRRWKRKRMLRNR